MLACCRLTDQEITHNLLLVLLAGHDTSSTTLARAMSNLQVGVQSIMCMMVGVGTMLHMLPLLLVYMSVENRQYDSWVMWDLLCCCLASMASASCWGRQVVCADLLTAVCWSCLARAVGPPSRAAAAA
jgi:hypothetical protein